VIDHKKLAVIHIVKKELGLTDTQYRDRLEEIAGVRSAKDLDEPGFRKLMNHFARSKHYRARKNGLTLRQKLYIKSLKEQLDWNEWHFKNFVKKYYKKTELESLTRKEASYLIKSLIKIIEHESLQSLGKHP
jgi:hypothetical protein